ncbi:MAG: hypothetical protein M9894_31140 [Planctomycetes bacterium]|nr:hypothetical protein [Planctomycetota bacterium]
MNDDAPRALLAARGVARRLAGAAVGGAVGLALPRWLAQLEPDASADFPQPAWAAWVTTTAWTLACLLAWCAALLLGLRLCRALPRRRPLVFAVFTLLAAAAGPGIAAAVVVLPEQSGGLDPFRMWPLLVEAVQEAGRPGAVPLSLSLGGAVPLGLVGVVLAGRPRAPAWALVTLAACGGYLGLAVVCRTAAYVDPDVLLGPVRHAAVLGLPGIVAGLALARSGGGAPWGWRVGWPLALATIALAVHAHTIHLVHHLVAQDAMVRWRPVSPGPAMRPVPREAGPVRWLGSGTIPGLRAALTGPHAQVAAQALALAGPVAREAVPDLLARAGAGDGRARATAAWAALRLAPDDEDVARAVFSLALAQRTYPGLREELAQALYLHDRPVAGRVLLDGLSTDDSSTRRETLRWLVHWWAIHPEHAGDAGALAEVILRAIASQPTTRRDLDLLFWPHRVFRLEALAPHVRAVGDAHPELAATADQVLACMEALGR